MPSGSGCKLNPGPHAPESCVLLMYHSTSTVKSNRFHKSHLLNINVYHCVEVIGYCYDLFNVISYGLSQSDQSH